jgi:hypothetical protein
MYRRNARQARSNSRIDSECTDVQCWRSRSVQYHHTTPHTSSSSSSQQWDWLTIGAHDVVLGCVMQQWDCSTSWEQSGLDLGCPRSECRIPLKIQFTLLRFLRSRRLCATIRCRTKPTFHWERLPSCSSASMLFGSTLTK